MVRAAIAIEISLVISSPLFGAEIRFRTMKVPPQANVQIEGSAAKINGGRPGRKFRAGDGPICRTGVGPA